MDTRWLVLLVTLFWFLLNAGSSLLQYFLCKIKSSHIFFRYVPVLHHCQICEIYYFVVRLTSTSSADSEWVLREFFFYIGGWFMCQRPLHHILSGFPLQELYYLTSLNVSCFLGFIYMFAQWVALLSSGTWFLFSVTDLNHLQWLSLFQCKFLCKILSAKNLSCLILTHLCSFAS